MSLKNVPFNQNKLILQDFEAHNAFTIKENVNTITHQVDEITGEYIIKNSNNNKILSVNLDGSLTQPSSIKSHISNSILPISQQVSVHQGKLNEHENRLSVVENNVGTNDLTSLENRVEVLENYIIKLKTFMNNFKAGLSNYGNCNFNDVIN